MFTIWAIRIYVKIINKMNPFNRIITSVLSGIIYPLSALIINSVFLMAVVPYLLYKGVQKLAHFCSQSRSIPQALTRLGGGIVATALLLPLALIISTVVPLYDFGKGIFEGLKSGFQKGFSQFFRELKKKIWYRSSFIKGIMYLEIDHNNGQNGIRQDQLDELQETTDAQKQHNIRLSKKELEQAESCSHLKETLQQYKNLYYKLEKLDKALEKREVISEKELKKIFTNAIQNPKNNQGEQFYLEVEDEVTYNSVLQPVLLIKEFKNENNQWTVIPGQTQIADKFSLEKWLKSNNSLQSTREAMDDAKLYKNRPTRYRYHTYQGYSKELHELTQRIKKGLYPSPVRASEIPTTFFSNRFAEEQDNDELEDEIQFLLRNQVRPG